MRLKFHGSNLSIWFIPLMYGALLLVSSNLLRSSGGTHPAIEGRNVAACWQPPKLVTQEKSRLNACRLCSSMASGVTLLLNFRTPL